jgi:hypothetical protein
MKCAGRISRYGSTNSTSLLDGVFVQPHDPAALPLGKRSRYQMNKRLDWPPQACLDALEKRNICFPRWKSNQVFWVVQFIVCHYIEYVVCADGTKTRQFTYCKANLFTQLNQWKLVRRAQYLSVGILDRSLWQSITEIWAWEKGKKHSKNAYTAHS